MLHSGLNVNINDSPVKFRSRLNGASEKKVCEAKMMLNIDRLHRYFMSRLEKTNGFIARGKESFVTPFTA